MKYPRDFSWIDHMIGHIETAIEGCSRFTDEKEFENDKLIRAGVTMSLLAFGELVKDSPDDLKALFSEYLNKIVSFRNRAAHGYHTIDYVIVWSIVKNYLGDILSNLKQQQAQVQKTLKHKTGDQNIGDGLCCGVDKE